MSKQQHAQSRAGQRGMVSPKEPVAGEPAGTYPPLRVGVRPKSVQSPTDMSSELSTVTTAARASPHLDLTMSILPGGQRARQGHVPDPPTALEELLGVNRL